MPQAFIHQIFYSPETRDSLAPGFAGLDNLRNERPDWREYWPIRKFLLAGRLRDDAYYGFFSPKFGAKTGLDPARVIEFVEQDAGASDVLLFSPFFDQIAYPINIFEQGAMQHADTLRTFRQAALCAVPGVDFDSLVMDSTNTVFCNFFVARPVFWRRWLDLCERIFSIAEKGGTDFGRRLNENTSHDGGGAPTKVFVIERIASLMLATGKEWRAKAFNPQALPWSGSALCQFPLEMAFLDALKIAYARQGHPQYLDAFHRLRGLLSESLAQAKA